MEAASARYAARDRFAYPSEPAATPLQRYIQNACSPENFEPNLALCLEISDLINAKKGSTPREAAVAIVGYVNHRNPNVQLLALSLLDICVKNCGYPFHLQISTKDFLNELVRRFPERPPMRTTRVQNRILELVEEWRRTICETSRYREDLGFIRDMHRLLHYKGYTFPEIRREDAAVLNPSDSLQSAEEMEAEERAAQSAKLQELIRRGTPHDLQEANKLMKVMAGYDTRHKTDYRAKAAEEVAKVQQKAKLLEEMLQSYTPGQEVKDGDVSEELANALASAHPKIQRMCEEESEDTEAVARLFEINDSIHRTIERYRLIKKGDVAGANAIPRGTLGVSGAGVRKGPDNELSLIDFGGADETSAAPAAAATGSSAPPPQTKGNALEDDLLGLNMGDGSYVQGGGGIALDSTNTHAGIMAQFSQPQSAPNSIFSMQSKPQPPPPPSASSTAAAPAPAASPSFDLFRSMTPSGVQGTPKSATPVSSSLPPQQQQIPKKSDPFASLSAATTPRQQSPFTQQQAFKPPANPPQQTGGIDLLGMGVSNGTATTTNTAAQDDEWEFSSSLPNQASAEITVTNASIKTIFTVTRSNDSELLIRSRVSNLTAQPVGELKFQWAVPKVYTLDLEPQSAQALAPKQLDGITQTIRLRGVEKGKGTSVKMRWRASFSLAGNMVHQQGEINGLSVS